MTNSGPDAFFKGTSLRVIRFSGLILYFSLATLLSLHCYRNSMYDIDLLGYAGNVALADTRDIVETHRAVYGAALTPHLRGQDVPANALSSAQASVLRRRAADPYFFVLYLPYFSIKPLYVLMLELVHKLGASVIDCSRIVSAFCYFAIAAVVWLYTRTWLGVLLLIIPETMVLGQANEPDGLSVCLLLLGLFTLFIKEHDLGLLPILLAVWVRPENSILFVIVILVLLAHGRLDWKKSAVLLCLCLVSSIVISHYAYDWKELYFHTFLGGDPTQIAHFGLGDYRWALLNGITQVVHSSVPVFSVLWLACFSVIDRGFQRIMTLSAGYSVIRFLMFPSYEPRYYALFFLVTGIAGVALGSRTWRLEQLWTMLQKEFRSAVEQSP